eukprot:CAMPEP_0182925312 /NCGR_PEP_ID=MMETSP0105_2-20130417/9192_1 /TAXON_ID=81532 ORGANISM="Acanthoeca-like sp., Strain 10tr" /NCGR_SAMPLE_ID=MMETSP0105_2 /ASSEMBLY_ACC=CAM_ASM_000205 /LENGTH=85 /DNA_ID=CAMNT_0025063155 /DNA_START=136 /DNA_END=394 /DNA_ORIENTATION=-
MSSQTGTARGIKNFVGQRWMSRIVHANERGASDHPASTVSTIQKNAPRKCRSDDAGAVRFKQRVEVDQEKSGGGVSLHDRHLNVR